jgi:hypothetical protein
MPENDSSENDSASMSPPRPLAEVMKDENPGPIVLEPEEFVEDVQVETD